MEQVAFGAAIALLILGGLLVLVVFAVASLHLASGANQISGVERLTVTGSIAASAGAGLLRIVRLLVATGLTLRSRPRDPAADSADQWRRRRRRWVSR